MRRPGAQRVTRGHRDDDLAAELPVSAQSLASTRRRAALPSARPNTPVGPAVAVLRLRSCPYSAAVRDAHAAARLPLSLVRQQECPQALAPAVTAVSLPRTTATGGRRRALPLRDTEPGCCAATPSPRRQPRHSAGRPSATGTGDQPAERDAPSRRREELPLPATSARARG